MTYSSTCKEIATYIIANFTNKKSTTSGTIEYVYHEHTDDCYEGCSGTLYVIEKTDSDSNGWCHYTQQCNKCKKKIYSYHQDDSSTYNYLNNVLHGKKICKYTKGEIESATITY